MVSDDPDVLVWTAVRVSLAGKFSGQLPRAEDEAALIEVFKVMPHALLQAAEEVARAISSGHVRWGWSALRAKLEKGLLPLQEAEVSVAGERSKAVRKAELWIANAGVHFDRESEVVDELFGGPSAMLGEWATVEFHVDAKGQPTSLWVPLEGADTDLISRMVARWQELRPRGVKAEEDHVAYMARLRGQDERFEAVRQARRDERAAQAALPLEVPAPVPV